MKRSFGTDLILNLALFLMTGLPFGLLAAPAVASSEDLSNPPTLPTEIQTGVYLIDLVKISGSEQMFTADIAVRFTWKDPRLELVGGAVRTVPLSEVWHPRLSVANARDAKGVLPEVVEIQPDGTVVYRQRMKGDFSARMDLHSFPFDTQTLPVHVVARGYDESQVRVVADEDLIGRSSELTMPDWAAGEVTLRSVPYEVEQLGLSVPGVKLEIKAERLVGYYVGTIFASAAIILCMAWFVFWLAPDALNPRISVSVTSMLTLIAHRFVISGQLPRLPYLTRMDFFLLGATFMVLFGLAGVVAVAKLDGDGHKESAVRLNKVFRWIYPALFVALLAFVVQAAG